MNSPQITAELLILNVHLYAVERDKSITRARVGRRAFMAIAKRPILSDAFMLDVKSACLSMGWILADIPEGFVMMTLGSIKTYTALAASRVVALKNYQQGNLFEQFPNAGVVDDDEEEL